MHEHGINICRPGYGASCSLCCGSHNYHADRREIEALFDRRAAILKEYSATYLAGKMAASRSSMTGSYYVRHEGAPFVMSLPALFADCPQCPFVGYTGDGRIAGCLLSQEERGAGLRHDCFMSYWGKILSCPAREILDDDEVFYAARLAGDWYYYSILIHEHDLLRGLIRDHPNAEKVPRERWERIKRDLEEQIAVHRELHAIHTYFF